MQHLRLLLVEDVQLFARSLKALLSAASDVEVELQHVDTLNRALQALAQDRYDCVLLDLHLPDGEGMECVERLRAQDARTTIVVLTGVDDRDLAIEALRRGAQEYAVKGEHTPDDLVRLILHAIERNRVVNALNEQRMREVEAARHDAMTGLPNRQLLAERARSILAAARQQATRVGLVYLDLDGFKNVNDRYGHDAGDAVLVEVARVLRQAVREPDVASRVGGDEFVVLLSRINESAEAQLVAERLVLRIGAITAVGGCEITIGASAGVALYPDHASGFEALVTAADAAMYEAKRAGKGAVRVHRAVEGAGAGLAAQDLQLRWRPWIGADNGEVRGLVAGFADRDAWDAAARRGEIATTGTRLLSTALQSWCGWRAERMASPVLAVEIQAAELGGVDFVATRLAMLQAHGVTPGEFQMQLSEEDLPALQPMAVEQLFELRQAGVGFSVVGVGRGDAALWPVARLPLNALRLDASVIMALCAEDRSARAVCAALVALARTLGVECCADGVRNSHDIAVCREVGVAALMGPGVARVLTTEGCTAWLAGHSRGAGDSPR